MVYGINHDDDDPPYVTSDELKTQAKVLEAFLYNVRAENGVFANTENPEDESTWLDMDIDDDNIVYNISMMAIMNIHTAKLKI